MDTRHAILIAVFALLVAGQRATLAADKDNTKATAIVFDQFKFKDSPSNPVSPHTLMVPHGNKMLAIVPDGDYQWLWFLGDDKAVRVSDKERRTVSGKLVECVLEGEPAIFWVGEDRGKPGSLVRVDNGKARSLCDTRGNPISTLLARGWARADNGHIAALLVSNDVKTESPCLLKDAVLSPLTEKPLDRFCSFHAQPSGKLVLECMPGRTSTRWIIDGDALVKPKTDPPVDDKFKPEVVYFMDCHCGLLCTGGPADGNQRIWIIKDGKNNWVADATGKPLELRYCSVSTALNSPKEELFITSFDYDDGGYTGRFFRLEGLKAVEIAAPVKETASNIVSCNLHGFIVSYMLANGTRHFILRDNAFVEITPDKGFAPETVDWCNGVKFGDAILVQCTFGKRTALAAFKDNKLTKVLECARDAGPHALRFASDGKFAAASWTDTTVHCVRIDSDLVVTPLSGPGGEDGSTSPVSLHLCQGHLYAPWTVGKSQMLLRWEMK